MGRAFKGDDQGVQAQRCGGLRTHSAENANWIGHKLIITDGCVLNDGDIAPLPALCDLAERYKCIMMVDDAHASGVLGRNGRGTIDHLNCMGACTFRWAR